jgi:hypothetical protein
MIKQTTDYQLFKKHPSNRPLDEGNLAKLQRSITNCNMLELRPILVDRSMRVIDGQHRLEAAERLNLPVFYQVNEAAEAKDMIVLNAFQKSWVAEDYLKFFAAEGNEDYKKLERFIAREGIKLRDCFSIFSGGYGPAYRQAFREGKWVFPDEVMIDEIKVIIKNCQEIIDFLSRKLVDDKKHLSSSYLFSSLIAFYNIKSVDHKTFMSKINLRLDGWHSCSTRHAYIDMMTSIYNWRNQQPISV